MVTGEAEEQIRSPRALFAQRFTELYEAAGNPTLRRVATAAEARMRAAQGNRPGGASAQRISDWKAGRNVPARFESLLPVVLTLVELARKAGHPLPRELAETREWQRLWHAATTWNPEEDDHAACPYPGLTSYRPENRTLFFGRTRATTELTALVRDSTGMVAVIGASGAGKSSLLGAGLLPTLADWETTALTPGPHPLTALLEAITDNVPAQLHPDFVPAPTTDHTTTTASNPQTAADLMHAATATQAAPDSGAGPVSESDGAPADPGTASATTPVAAIRVALAPRSGGPRRLLVIDQFEELFTACDSEQEREEFLTVLNSCAERADDPIAVVVALRADFYAHCLNYLVLQDALEHRSYLLGPMRPDELAQAISGPARAVGLELEPGLEELVITELCGAGDHHGRRTYDPGALPLLSHVMAATWQHREGRRLTVTGYRNAGGVVGSVAETAEYAWNELSSTQREAAKAILLGLVTVTQDSRDTRRPAQRPDLLRLASNPEDATAALELLSRTRLTTLDSDAVTLTHEIILTAWPRLRAWIDEDRVGYLTRQRLETDAAEWAAQERDSSLLYRGTRLHNALDNVDPPPVGPLAHEFLTAASTARDHTRRRSSRTRTILALLGVALLILGFTAYTEIRLADQRRDDKNFAAVLTSADQIQQTDPSLAAQLNLIAWRMRPGDQEVRSRLLRTQNTPLATATPAAPQSVAKLVYQAGGKTLAALSSDGGLHLWDTTDAQHPRSLGRQLDGIGDVDFSPDGTLMATTGSANAPDHPLTLWDISVPSTPRPLSTLPQLPDSTIAKIAFAPDGRTLATLTLTQLTLWNISHPAAPVMGPSRQLNQGNRVTSIGPLRFSPNGHMLALVVQPDEQSQVVQLWGASTDLTLLAPALGGAINERLDLAFSADSGVLAIGSSTEGIQTMTRSAATVRLWDVTEPDHARQYPTLETGLSGLWAITFSSEGRVLAASGASGAGIWDLAEPADPGRIVENLPAGLGICHYGGETMPCTSGPTALAFAPGSHTLAAGDGSGTIKVWSLPSAVLTGQAGWVTHPIFDSTGSRMVTASSDGRFGLWDVRNPQAPKRIGEYQVEPGFSSASLSADGSTLLVRDPSNNSRLILDISDPAHIRTIGQWQLPISKNGGVTFSDDWRLLATFDGNMLQLWDLSDRARPVPIGRPWQMPAVTNSVYFGPDNKTLAIDQLSHTGAQPENVITLWDISDPAHPRQISELLRRSATNTARTVLTPNLQRMIVIDNETIQSWDISDPARPIRLGEPVALHTLSIRTVAFTTDSRTLLTSSDDGALRLWDFHDPAYPALTATLLQSGPYSWDASLDSDGRSVAAGSADGAIRLWDLDEQHAIDRICTVTGSMWTPELWHRYLPQLPYKPPCN
ncbi:hypothetical protein [Nocardia sp. NPDC006630]|uniref:nSTAND1 domain-containing NTPase n=1 Tax=Nocardia sp. NPDC006630 TaxID=3157181 RepID=UPI0033A4FA7D